MVQYRQRRGLAQLAAVLGILAGGGAGGAALGMAVASDSLGGILISGVMLPFATFLGVTLWFGAAVLFVTVQLVRGRSRRRDAAARERFALPPGSVAFVPSAVGSALVAAGVVSALSTEANLLAIVGPYFVVGLAYGLATWWLARAGYFPAPDGT
ncbi:MAG: hypothetical protein PHR35_06310 [Kiritimatiellae bacterium]|nr:hypothetical protein [Kiritimatiellia bacterium]